MNFIDKLREQEFLEDGEFEEEEGLDYEFIPTEVLKKLADQNIEMKLYEFSNYNQKLIELGIEDKEERYRIIEILMY